MSKYKIDALLRIAIFEAYGKKCFYTGIPLDYQDMEIDHIIPESLADKIDEIKSDYGLDKDFNINGCENLVPTRHDINNRKSNTLFDKATTLYYISLAKSHKDKILNLYKNKQKTHKAGCTLKSIEMFIENGSVTIDDVKLLLEKIMEEKWVNSIIKLNIPIYFKDLPISEIPILHNYFNYEVKPLELYGDGNGLTLFNDENKKIYVQTLQEWKDALEKNFYPLRSSDIKMSAYFIHLEGLFSALSMSRKPLISFVKNKSLNLLFKDFNTSFLKVIDIENNLKVSSMHDLIDTKEVTIVNYSDTAISFITLGFCITITEVFRADITQNGIEDIFCYISYNADGGTLGWGDVAIISKNTENGICEISPLQ